MRTERWRWLRNFIWPAIVVFVIWCFSPGLPILIGPWATANSKAEGEALFTRHWQPNDALAMGDGLGPVFNATSCADCHFQGGLGGAGNTASAVNTFEILPSVRDPNFTSGLVHRFAAAPGLAESDELLRETFPIVPGGVRQIGGCSVTIVDFDPIRQEKIDATSLFGVGWIDLISEKAIEHNRSSRTWSEIGRSLKGELNGVPVGRARYLPDGRIGKFGWKAQFATLEEFVAAACANELGLGNPMCEQPAPLADRSYASPKHDLTKQQVKRMVAFVATLPRPQQVMPDEPKAISRVKKGEQLFNEIGCAQCHTPNLCGVDGVYSDLLLHRLTDQESRDGYREEPVHPVPPPPSLPDPDEWRTPPLWGVADTAPYFHDGESPTLHAAITRHRGQAKRVTEAFSKLGPDEQQAIIEFLQTLKAPANATPIDPPAPPAPPEVPRQNSPAQPKNAPPAPQIAQR